MDNQNLDKQAASGGNGMAQPEAQRPQGRLLVFKLQSPSDEPGVYRLLLHNESSGGIPERKVAQLVSKHAPGHWRPMVGARVAALSEGRIVQGVILGIRAKPWRPAAFYRRGFTGCWILLDTGTKIVANEMRPIKGPQTKLC
jgi:hypothetical protein